MSFLKRLIGSPNGKPEKAVTGSALLNSASFSPDETGANSSAVPSDEQRVEPTLVELPLVTEIDPIPVRIPEASGQGPGTPPVPPIPPSNGHGWGRDGADSGDPVGASQAESGDEQSQAALRGHDVVHEALKGADVNLGFQVSALEKQAIELAQVWAEKGLPRHDVERSSLTEPEEVLANRAREVYWGWVKLIRRKMRGAIARELQEAGRQVEVARTELLQYKRDQQQLAALQPRQISPLPDHTDLSITEKAADEAQLLDIAEASGEGDEQGGTRGLDLVPVIVSNNAASDEHSKMAAAPVRPTGPKVFEAHFPWYFFYPLMGLLLLADFVANAPVFTELFPVERAVDTQVASWIEERVIDLGSFGPAAVWMRLKVYTEASILALSVILFFLWLGHNCGGALRPIVVLHGSEHEEYGKHARILCRQARWPLFLTLIGIVLTIAMLAVARTKVTEMAGERFARAQLEYRRADSVLQQVLKNPDQIDIIDAAQRAVADAQEELSHRRLRLDYAQSIRALNVPITGFNVVLVIAAIAAGYKREEIVVDLDDPEPAPPAEPAPQSVDDAKGAQTDAEPDPNDALAAAPEVERLRVPEERLTKLRVELRGHRAAMSAALSGAQVAINRADQLLGADPFREWHGVERRLSCAVPSFRAENARLRGLDPNDVLAFRVDAHLDLEVPVFTAEPAHVATLQLLKSDHEALMQSLRLIEASGRGQDARANAEPTS